jgi:hypothetical protein
MQIRAMSFLVALAAAVPAASTSFAQARHSDVSSSGGASGSVVIAQQTYIDVMAGLEAAGYEIVEAKSTFLGRVKIMARNAEHMREIVVSRATGEVKRDVIVELFVAAEGTESDDASVQSRGILGLFGSDKASSAGATGSASVGTSAGVSVSGGSVSADSSSGGSVSGGVSAGTSGGSVSGGVSTGVSGGLGIGN